MTATWAEAPKPYVIKGSDPLPACPGCGYRKWWRGRMTAQCGVCEYPIDLEHVTRPAERVIFSRGVAASTGTKTGQGVFS